MEKIAFFCLLLFLPLLFGRGDGRAGQGGVMTVKDLLALPPSPADHTIFYGEDPLQFGELRLPDGPGPFPVAVVIHGGCWMSAYDLGHISPLASALTGEGMATWSLEYRRVGDRGGGWPGTFLDAAAGLDHLRIVGPEYDLDLDRVVVIGHSAGGHLALWLAARKKLASSAELYSPHPLPIRGMVTLAGIGDLEGAFRTKICGDAVGRLMGGSPEHVPLRYAQGSPRQLLPLGVPGILLQGIQDTVVPAESARSFAEEARGRGDTPELVLMPQVGHYELIVPGSPAWPEVLKRVRSLLGER